MPFYFFHWDEPTIRHLAENDVSPEEFEQVVCSARKICRSRTTGNPLLAGYTDEGRYLVCVFKWHDKHKTIIIPVTAFEPPEKE